MDWTKYQDINSEYAYKEITYTYLTNYSQVCCELQASQVLSSERNLSEEEIDN